MVVLPRVAFGLYVPATLGRRPPGGDRRNGRPSGHAQNLFAFSSDASLSSFVTVTQPSRSHDLRRPVELTIAFYVSA